jgi:UDP-N-acetylglucosamine 4-epimerase
VQANLLAGTTTNPDALNRAYNVAVGERTTLNSLFELLKSGLRERDPSMPDVHPIYRDFRAGDVPHSLADITKAQQLLGYSPTHRITDGIDAAFALKSP